MADSRPEPLTVGMFVRHDRPGWRGDGQVGRVVVALSQFNWYQVSLVPGQAFLGEQARWAATYGRDYVVGQRHHLTPIALTDEEALPWLLADLAR